MHDLKRTTALGAATPVQEQVGDVLIAENADVALASVSARLGREADTARLLKSGFGITAPNAGAFSVAGDYTVFWTGPDQWMISTSLQGHELIADELIAVLGNAASVTEQSGAWVQFDVSGGARTAMLERLTALPVRRMKPNEAGRTRIEQLGCFVLCAESHFVILGPRASAQSLYHSLITAARSIA